MIIYELALCGLCGGPCLCFSYIPSDLIAIAISVHPTLTFES